MSWFTTYVSSPGFGGVGALAAAAVVGYAALRTSAARTSDANSDRDVAEKKADVDRLWDRLLWIMSKQAEVLPLAQRFLLINQMADEAATLGDLQIRRAAEAYSGVLNQKIAGALAKI